ncbi:TPA: hypothetical protein ACGY8I_003022, partial [Aeromonas hydrophila]
RYERAVLAIALWVFLESPEILLKHYFVVFLLMVVKWLKISDFKLCNGCLLYERYLFHGVRECSQFLLTYCFISVYI